MSQLELAFDKPISEPLERPKRKRKPKEKPSFELPSDLAYLRSETSQRLRELLDRNQFELWKYGGEGVTCEEAIRDMIFIEAELRRRAEAWLETELRKYG